MLSYYAFSFIGVPDGMILNVQYTWRNEDLVVNWWWSKQIGVVLNSELWWKWKVSWDTGYGQMSEVMFY